MVRLKSKGGRLNPTFEVVSGKKDYKVYLGKIDKSVEVDNIIYYEVIVVNNEIFLDYNRRYEPVSVKKLTKKALLENKGREKGLLEDILTEEFDKYNK